MKLKNIFLAVLATGALGWGATACNDSFLEEKIFSSYGPDVQDVNAKLVGLHYIYAQIWGMSSQQGFPGIWQVGTDVGSPGDTQGVEVPFYQYGSLNSENAGISYLWEKLYEIVNNANLIIASIADDAPAAELAQKAEAMFFRAYAYNMMVTLWGKVPLIVESTTSPKTDYTRNEIVEIDAVIDADLTFAMANLPKVGQTSTENRINRDVARMQAAEAYLRMGMRDASYFEKAENAVSLVITEGNYSLIEARYGKFTGEGGDYYSDMFRWGNQRRSQGNTEAIWVFQMEYNRNVNGGTIDNPQQRRNWVPGFHKINGMINADSIGGRGNGRLRLSNFVKYGLYAEGDIRNSNYNIRRTLWYNKPDFTATIGLDAKGFNVGLDSPNKVREVTVKTGDKAYVGPSDSLNVMYPHPTKWGGYDPTDDFGYAIVKDWPLMRLGEAYLLRAEARFRRNNASGAAADINKLRDRAFKESRAAAGDPTLGQVAEGQITIDFILDERVRELIAEENRRMTLMRTNTLASRILLNGDAVPYAPDSKVITGFQPYHNLLPLPLGDIQLNKDAVLEQNPGYSK